jgi:hypothetical protein
MTKNSILIVAFVLTTNNICGQIILKLDTAKISRDTELNFFKTTKRGIESNTNGIFYVDDSMQTIIAIWNGQVKWKVDIIKACGKPFVGHPSIRYIKLDKGKINVTFGKHDNAIVDCVTGKITCLGAD